MMPRRGEGRRAILLSRKAIIPAPRRQITMGRPSRAALARLGGAVGQRELRCYIAERCADVDSAFARACRIALGIAGGGRTGGCGAKRPGRVYCGMRECFRNERSPMDRF